MKNTFASKDLGLKIYVRRTGQVVKAIAEMRFGKDTVKNALDIGLLKQTKVDSIYTEPGFLLECNKCQEKYYDKSLQNYRCKHIIN